MKRREKRPDLDENQKKVILSRLFGDKFIAHPTKEDVYLGYVGEAIVEVWFYGFFCTVEQRYGSYKAIKFGNLIMNKFFATRGLRCYTEERINFDNTTCAHVFYDDTSISFYFWYRVKENAA